MRLYASSSWIGIAALVVLGAATIPLCAEDNRATASSSSKDSEINFLVLQDGGLLEGKTTPAADWYVVARPGGQMQIAKSRVVFACRTLDEAYAYLRKQIDAAKPQAHLSLAEWCLRYGLLTAADQELADARRLDPDLPRVALLERRLEQMRAQPGTTSKAQPAKTLAKNATQPSKQTSMTVDLPNGVVERFTRKVQPVLVNSCTASACHQPGGRQSFQLDRAILRGEANRRSTMRNLEATLALIDRSNPEQSPLLLIGRKKHGGISGPIFGPRQEQAFKHVSDWVLLVAPPAATEPKPETANAPESKRGIAANDTGQDPSPSTTASGDSALNEPGGNGNDPPTLRQPHRLQYGGTLRPWRPRDPFDPEIFNRLQQTNATQVETIDQQPAVDAAPAQATVDQAR